MRVQWELLKAGVSLSLCKYSDVPPEHSLNKSVQISNMWGLAEANEYPHAPSYRIDDLDDPVLAMALIKGADKGVFGVNDIITRGDMNGILKRAQEALKITAKGEVLDGREHNLLSRGDLAKAVYDAFPALKDIVPPKNARIPFKAGKHRNSEYVEVLGRLGILDVYGIEGEFYYGRPVTKGEAADVVVRACVAALGK